MDAAPMQNPSVPSLVIVLVGSGEARLDPVRAEELEPRAQAIESALAQLGGTRQRLVVAHAFCERFAARLIPVLDRHAGNVIAAVRIERQLGGDPVARVQQVAELFGRGAPGVPVRILVENEAGLASRLETALPGVEVVSPG